MGITALPFSSVIDVPTARILGRDDAGTGAAEALTNTEIFAILATGTPSASTYLRGDGTWAAVSAGISSLNGLTGATQTFAVGTSGTDVAFVSAAGVHTLNIPDASATARGVVTTGAQSFAGVKSFTAQEIRLSSDGGTALRIWRNGNNLQIDNAVASVNGNVVISQNGSIGAIIRGQAWGTTLQATKGIDISTAASGGFGVSLDCPIRGTLEQWDNNTATQAQRYHLNNIRTSSTSFERLEIGWATNVCTIAVTAGSAGGTLRGLRIGGAATSLLGFYGATPVDQPATITDPTGGGTIDAEARTAINTIIDRLQELGLIA